MSRRILHIVSSLQYSGALRQLALLNPALRAAGYESHVLPLRFGSLGPMVEELLQSRLAIQYIPMPGHQILPIAATLARIVKDIQPNVVHTWTPMANRRGRLPVMLTEVSPMIASLRVPQERPGFMRRHLDRMLDVGTDGFLCNSSITREAFCERFRHADRVHLVPNAVQIPAATAADARQAWSEKWGIPAEAKWIAAVGPLTPIKRIKDLIWATDLLKVMRPDAYLVVMGDGPHEWRLNRFCDQVRIRDRVVFAGNVPDLPNVIGMFDCLWHASGWESCPNAVLEAMASGIPVVAADCAGTRAVVIDERHGALVPIGNRPAFARATLPLLDDPTLARKLGAAARESVARRFGVQAAADRYLNLLRNVCEANRNGKSRRKARS